MYTIITVSQHNANQNVNLKFRNSDGSLRTRGYVVCKEKDFFYCSTKEAAEHEATIPYVETPDHQREGFGFDI